MGNIAVVTLDLSLTPTRDIIICNSFVLLVLAATRCAVLGHLVHTADTEHTGRHLHPDFHNQHGGQIKSCESHDFS